MKIGKKKIKSKVKYEKQIKHENRLEKDKIKNNIYITIMTIITIMKMWWARVQQIECIAVTET